MMRSTAIIAAFPSRVSGGKRAPGGHNGEAVSAPQDVNRNERCQRPSCNAGTGKGSLYTREPFPARSNLTQQAAYGRHICRPYKISSCFHCRCGIYPALVWLAATDCTSYDCSTFTHPNKNRSPRISRRAGAGAERLLTKPSEGSPGFGDFWDG